MSNRLYPTCIEIEVSGPGELINHEIYHLRNILREKGFKVKIDNNHPPKKNFEVNEKYAIESEIIIKANHLPWGG